VAVVAITGVSQGLGAHLVSQVQCDPEVTRIIAIDDAAPPGQLDREKVLFVRRTVAQSWEDVFREHEVDVAIHAGLCDPLRDRAREEAINIGGTRRFLEACHASNASTVCVITSAAAYGAFRDNADYMFEGAPLRATMAFPHAHDAAQAEGLCYEYAAKHPDVCLQIVRACPVIGPSTQSFWVRLLERRLYLAPWGHQPVLQLVHEDDATRAVWRLVKQQRIGVFNVAGDAYVTLAQVARLLDRRVLHLPVFLLRLVVWLAWRLGRTEVPPGFVDYLLHPWLINPTKIKAEAMFVFRFDSPRAVLDWVEARDEAARPRAFVAVPDDAEDLDDDELFEPEVDDVVEEVEGAVETVSTTDPADPTDPFASRPDPFAPVVPVSDPVAPVEPVAPAEPVVVADVTPKDEARPAAGDAASDPVAS
jgi:UDP-glucose 4-epimerase